MKRCVIHIGMHKTGSTSIQDSLYRYVDSDFMYARLGNTPNHSLAIYSLFSARPELHQLHQINRRDAAAVHDYVNEIYVLLEQAIADAQGRTLIISGEDISVLPQKDVAKLAEYFKSRFDEVKIVGYVRPPAGFIVSGFQERVKGGMADELNLEKQYRNYEGTFKKFDMAFGIENVELWKFAPETFPDGCVVRDFCTRLNIKLPETRVVRVNESLPRLAASMLYIYRKFGKACGSARMKGPEAQAIGSFLKSVDQKKFRFSPDVIRPVLEKNRADIKWMEARLGQSLYEELGEHQAGDVCGEPDLLRPDPLAVSKLLTLLGDAAPKNVKGETPEEIALVVHALRKMNEQDCDNKEGGIQMTTGTSALPEKMENRRVTVISLYEQMQQTAPELFGSLPRPRAIKLIRAIFEQVTEILAQSPEGMVTFGGLGEFRARKIERVVESKKIMRTQIVFRPAVSDKKKESEKA